MMKMIILIPPQLDSDNHGVVIDNSDTNNNNDDSLDDLAALPVPELNTIDFKDTAITIIRDQFNQLQDRVKRRDDQ